jgi:CRISPR-associated protein Csm5
MVNVLNVRLHIVSPVHIGCGDVYEPTSFMIDERRQKLIEFDPIDFIRSLSATDRERFTAICMEGTISSIVDLYRFVSGRPIKGREVEIASGLPAHYKEMRALNSRNEAYVKREINQFTISRTAFNPYTKLAYIPGSSLKGALRTAYLSKLAKDAGIREWGKTRGAKAAELEKILLGGTFASDPFRMVKSSDLLPVRSATAKVVYAVNKKKKMSKFEARGPFQIVEAITDGTRFEGVINIQEPERLAGIKKPITAEGLLRAVHDFYMPLMIQESKITDEVGTGNPVAKMIDEEFRDRLGKSAFLVRIGRHSGAEAVTIEGNRDIKIMQGGGAPAKYLDHATTIWLASETSKPTVNSGLVPFGWAVLEVVDKLTESAAGRETDAEHHHLNSPALERASIADVHEATLPETDPSDSLMEKLLRDVARCRGPQDKHVLVRAFDEAKALPQAKRLEFLQKVEESLPAAMKANAKIKAFLQEQRQAFEAAQ